MKAVIWLLFLVVFIFSCQHAKPNPWVESEPFQQWCPAVFISDSGFVSRQQEQQLERLICQIDTAIFPPTYCAKLVVADPDTAQDIAGKYYRSPLVNGTRYVLCLNVHTDWVDENYVLEIQQTGQQYSIVSWTNFEHAFYACCWDEPGRLSGFYRVGSYFVLETCSRGSGLCAGDANVLFFPLQKSHPATIPRSFFQSASAWPELLESSLSSRGDTIIGNYEYKRDSIVVIDPDHDYTIPLEQYRFQALFRINTTDRKIELLNRDFLARYHPAMFYEFE